MSTEPGWVRRHAIQLAMLGAYAISRVLYAIGGVTFDIKPISYGWQIIDPELLQTRALESLWYYHSQPPLFNAFIAFGLRFPLPPEQFFHAAYLAMGVGIMFLCYDLGRRLGLGPKTAAVLAVAIAVSPTMVLYENWLFYEYPLALLLLAVVDLFHRYVTTGALRPFGGMLAAATAMVLIRAAFHPLWLVALVLFALLARRPAFGWRKASIAIAIPALLVGVLLMKNAVLFGSPSLSSWFGMNLQRATTDQLNDDERRALIDDGRIARSSDVAAFKPLESYPREGPPCVPEHADVPVLAEVKTSTGNSNLNSECWLPLFQTAQHDGLVVMRSSPARVAHAEALAYQIFFKPPSRYGWLDEQRSHIEGFDSLYRTWVLWEVPMADPGAEGTHRDVAGLRDLHVSLLAVLAWVVATAGGVAGAWRWWRRGRNAQRCTIALAGLTTTMLTVVGNTFEFGENDRFRFMIEPLQFVLLAVCIVYVARRARERWSPSARLDGDETSQSESSASRPAPIAPASAPMRAASMRTGGRCSWASTRPA